MRYHSVHVNENTEKKHEKINSLTGFRDKIWIRAPWIRGKRIIQIGRICYFFPLFGVRGGAVGWSTGLQAGKSRVRFPMVSLKFFHWHIPSARTMALELTQPLTEMSTRNISWGVKAADAWGWQPHHLHVPNDLKSGNILDPSGPVQACNGITLSLPLFKKNFSALFYRLWRTRRNTRYSSLLVAETCCLDGMYVF
jgi:hypothetical protein